jgi:hypothetical protein
MFKSIDAPPERHADRVIAEMLRELTKTRAQIGPAMVEAVRQSKDGGPRAQQRMAERIRKAGVMNVSLKTGRSTSMIRSRTSRGLPAS